MAGEESSEKYRHVFHLFHSSEASWYKEWLLIRAISDIWLFLKRLNRGQKTDKDGGHDTNLFV